MKKMKISLALASLFLALGLFMSADHIDAPLVTGGKVDLTDLYVFQSPENSNNLVFAANVQGLLDPASTSAASFDPNSMLEFNIDNDGDNVEDLVIQCIYEDGMLRVYGPVAPQTVGTTSRIDTGAGMISTGISTYGASPMVAEGNGMKAFAGPRDDPFFFDFVRYTEILGGTQTGFANPGNDTFAGTNVLATIIEVPKNQLGGTGMVNVWVESKRK